MVHQFVRKELSDARDRVNSGSYNAAAQFVSNAKADIEDAPWDFGRWKTEFDKYHDEFQQEAGNNNPDEGQLIHCLDKLDHFVEAMVDIRDQREADEQAR
jgi:hypothetical protein